MPNRPASSVAALSAAAALLVLAAGRAPAQDADASRVGGVSSQQLEEIIVRARSLETTRPIELAEYGADVEFVTADQIEGHGFVDTTQALEMLVPDLNMSTQAGAFSYVDISLQGSRDTDVLWTVDGTRINNRLYNSTSPADTLPSSMIERIEVLKGGHGLLYGTQAIAGVINVVTRGLSDTPEGAINVGVDENNGRHIDGYFAGAIGDHNIVAWASQDETDGFRIYDNYQPSATRRDRGYDVSSMGAKYGYDFSDSARLSLRAVHTEAALDYPRPDGANVNDRTEDVVSARLDFSPSDTAQFFVKSYYHDWDTNYYTPPEPADPPYWGYDDFGVGAGGEIAPEASPVEYHVGFDFQRYQGVDEVLQIAGLEEQVRALYGQIRTSDEFSEQTRLAFGARHNETGGSNTTVGSISGAHHFTESFYIEGVLGTSFLLPSAYNLYNVDTCCAYGNSSLEAEESVSLNLAVGGELEAGQRRLSWQLTGWDRSVDNLIDSAPVDETSIAVPPGYSSVHVNVDGEVEMRGASFLLRGPITDALSFSANFTYSSEEEADTGEQLSGRPLRHQKYSLQYRPAAGPFAFNAAVKHVGETSESVNAFPDQRYGDYYVANLGATFYLDAERNQRLNLRLENAFDETYATDVGSTEHEVTEMPFLYRRLGPPRTAYLDYSHSF